MLLVIDVGNTNTVVGVYTSGPDPARLVGDWRFQTVHGRTADELGILLLELLRFAGIDHRAIGHAIVSCVVPPALLAIEQMGRKYLGLDVMVVGPGIRTGMPVLYDNPKEVGADRIVNAVAAYERLKTTCIVVDFGTATTFDSVSVKGEYLGGAIAPGIAIAATALFREAAKLPRVELVKPRSVVGKNTVHSMQAGLIYGYVGLVDGIVTRMIAEMGATAGATGGARPRVIATGGLAEVIAKESQTVEIVDGQLTIDGLRLLFERNRSS
jgi:type III pantothenate kinase